MSLARSLLVLMLPLAVALAAGATSRAAWAQIDVFAERGDNLVRLLRRHGAEGDFAELQPLIEQTVRDNPHAFRNRDPNRLIAGELLRLPIARAEPPPAPAPEPAMAAPEPIAEPIAAAAPPPIGELEVVRGTASLERPGAQRLVSDRERVFSGDAIETATQSRARLRFADGSEVELGPSTRFAIEEYQPPAADESGGRALLRLLEGAVRALSGLIGTRPGSEYALLSATATVGIRGTDYTARFCVENCGELAGLSVGVADGAVALSNDAGELALAQGEFARVERADAAPVSAPLPPGFFDLDVDAAAIEVDEPWYRQLLDFLGL